MNQHYAVRSNCKICFKSEEKAKTYCKEHNDYSYKFENEWKYYDSQSRNSTTPYITISGETLIDAIEQNFVQIMKSMSLYGASGYRLKSVKLVRQNNKTELVVESWPFSDALVGYTSEMCNDENLRIKRMEILGVEEDEILNDEYVFELKKSS